LEKLKAKKESAEDEESDDEPAIVISATKKGKGKPKVTEKANDYESIIEKLNKQNEMLYDLYYAEKKEEKKEKATPKSDPTPEKKPNPEEEAIKSQLKTSKWINH